MAVPYDDDFDYTKVYDSRPLPSTKNPFFLNYNKKIEIDAKII